MRFEKMGWGLFVHQCMMKNLFIYLINANSVFPLIQSSRKQYVALAAGWLGGGGGGPLADIWVLTNATTFRARRPRVHLQRKLGFTNCALIATQPHCFCRHQHHRHRCHHRHQHHHRCQWQLIITIPAFNIRSCAIISLQLCTTRLASKSIESSICKPTTFDQISPLSRHWLNSDNWEPEFMTIFVTWQLRVTLDSIRNSCNIFVLFNIFVCRDLKKHSSLPYRGLRYGK